MSIYGNLLSNNRDNNELLCIESVSYDNTLDNLLESYIEESNNFENMVLKAVNESISKETFIKIKDGAVKSIKAVIEAIGKFVIFIKTKISDMIGKIKEKIGKIKKRT